MPVQRPFGVTKGAVSLNGPDKPEQVYVFQDEGQVEEHVDYGTVERPYRVEGRVGYKLDSRMRLTRNQARELAVLLWNATADESQEAKEASDLTWQVDEAMDVLQGARNALDKARTALREAHHLAVQVETERHAQVAKGLTS